MAEQRPPPQSTPHVGPEMAEPRDLERFAGPELATVLSHYDLGVIRSIRSFPLGSRRAPKVRIQADTGEYLLKRRASGRDDPQRVAYAHRLQLFLAEKGYPVPRLVGTRHHNNSIVQNDGRVYEMFEYVRGTRYDLSREATEAAGEALGRLHRLLEGYQSEDQPPLGTYHGLEMDAALRHAPHAVAAVEPEADRAALRRTCRELRKAYTDAAARAEHAGFGQWSLAIIHGDWHPGNLRYRGQEVVAVMDFDSVRLEPRVSDVANAALQFSMLMGEPEHPADWPEGLDLPRIRGLVVGYDRVASCPLHEQERAALAWLMIEALIMESAVPIAGTGSFARLPGSSFLLMVQRKVRWIQENTRQIAALGEREG